VKIVHLLGWYFPDSVGGSEVYVEGLCQRLRDAGHQVLIAAPDTHQGTTRTYTHDGVTVFRYAISDDATRDEAHHRVPVRGARAFYEWLDDQRPDVLHVHSFTTGVGLPEIREARRLGIRVVATSHLPGLGYMCRAGELMQWGRFPCDGIVIPDKCASCNLTRLGLAQPLSRVAGAVPVGLSQMVQHLPGRLGTTLGMSASVVEYQAMQRELFTLIDRFVVLNESARRMLVANGSPTSKLALNRLGLSHRGIVRKPGPDEKPTMPPVRFGYVGRLHPAKGLAELVRAASAVPRDVAFVMDIRGPMLDDGSRAYVDQLRAIAGDDHRLVFGPGVPGSEVPALLASLDVLLCPSIWFENGPTVAIEAFAVGTPIIASRVGNLAELVEDHASGRLVESGDVDSLSRVIEETARHPRETIDRWRRGIPAVRTMDDIARDYLALYAA